MSKIENYIESKEEKNFKFVPDPVFYRAVGINKKRWALIYRGKIEPTVAEAKAIAGFFEIDLNEII